MNDKSNQFTPPYVPATVFDRFWGITKKRRWDVISVNGLQDQGFSEAQSYALFSALKFLRLVDEDGNPLPNLKLLWESTTSEDDQKAISKIIREAYPDLVATDLTSQDINTIDGFFRRNYNVSPSVAPRTARFFIWLANQAGIEIGDEVAVTKTTPKSTARNTPAKPDERKAESLALTDAGDYEEKLLQAMIEKIRSSNDIPDVNLFKEVRDLANKIEERKRRSADYSEPDAANKQESEDKA